MRRARAPRAAAAPGRTSGAALAATLGAALGTACAVDPPTAPAAAPSLVLFAVLDPSRVDQVVLLMQSRASAPSLAGRAFNPSDPIVSAGETAVTGATVVVYNAAGDSAVLVEDRVRRTDKLGAGVYRMAATAGAYLPVRAGQAYRLRVHSTLGDAEGTARVPAASRAPVTGTNPSSRVTIGRDSVVLPEIAVTGGAGFVYTLRTVGGVVEASPQYRRDLERRLLLPSGEDWAFAYARDRLAPGTNHVLTVHAADSSYFAYYSADTDPFADRTARTTLRGAAGVFGAVLLVAAVPVSVTR